MSETKEENLTVATKIPSLLNRSRIKQLALAIATNTRAKGFTRVGKSFIDRVEARVRNLVADEVRIHPSVGKTLK